MHILNKVIGSMITTVSLVWMKKVNVSAQVPFTVVSTHEDFSLIHEPCLCVGPVTPDTMTLRLHLTTACTL